MRQVRPAQINRRDGTSTGRRRSQSSDPGLDEPPRHGPKAGQLRRYPLLYELPADGRTPYHSHHQGPQSQVAVYKSDGRLEKYKYYIDYFSILILYKLLLSKVVGSSETEIVYKFNNTQVIKLCNLTDQTYCLCSLPCVLPVSI